MANAAKFVGAAAFGLIAAGVAYMLKNPDNEPETTYYVKTTTKKPGIQWGTLLFGLADAFRTPTGGASDAGGGYVPSGSYVPADTGSTAVPAETGGSTYVPSGGGGSAQVLLDFIARGESGGSYSIIYGGSPVRPPKDITQMTVGEVRAFQDSMVRGGSASSAVGKYQIIRKTMDTLSGSRSAKFDRAMQDNMGLQLLNRRGYQSYKSGSMSLESFALGLAKEWASLPVLATGRSYYAGDGLNAANASVSGFKAALAAAR